MASEEGYRNLIPLCDRTKDEQRRIASEGGKASGAARRKRRALKDAADLYLSLPVTDNRVWNRLALSGLEIEEIDNQMAMIAGLHATAVAGNPAAGRVILEMLGENTKDDPLEDQLLKAKELLGGIDGVIE